MFDANGTNIDSYRLNIEARTSAVTGGTLVEIFAEVTKTRTHGGVATTGGGTRSWSLPGGRDGSTSGALNNSGGSSWTYSFPAASTNTVNVYNYFNVYVPYSQGASTTLSVTAAGSGSSFLTSRTLSVTVPLYQPAATLPAPTNPSVVVGGDRFTIRWTAASGVSTYGIWWNSTTNAPTAGASSDYPGITGTEYPDFHPAGTTRHYWVSSQTVGTPSAWIYAGGGTIPSTVNLTYNFNGNGSSDVVTAVTPGTTFTLRSAPTRSGYTFNGWNDSGGTSYGSSGTSSQNAPLSDFTLYAQWTLVAITPSFTDSAVASPATMGLAYSDGVTATNASSYSIFSGALPAGLSLNTSNGTITGTPTAQGSSTFVIRATSSTSNTTNTGSLTIDVLPPGQRFTSTTARARLSTAKRWNGSQWVELTLMRVWNGSQWINQSNTNIN